MAAGVGGVPTLVVGATTLGCACGAPVVSLVGSRVGGVGFWVSPASTCTVLVMACVGGVVFFTGSA